MKKLNRLKFSASILIVLFLTAPTFVVADTEDELTSVEEETLEEIKTVTPEDVWAMLNCGLMPEGWNAEPIYDENIEIIDFDSFVHEEPERFYYEYMTDEEIEAVHIRMANGENVMFGDGITHSFNLMGFNEFGTSSIEQNRWKSNKTYPMHQWLVERGFLILQNGDGTIRNFYNPSQIAIIKKAADWPDSLLAISESSFIFNNHFYHYQTETNYWHNKLNKITAKSKFIEWYDEAVNNYKSATNSDDKIEALKQFGYAIHYISDLATPVHTGERSISGTYNPLEIAHEDYIQAEKHSQYEIDAYNARNEPGYVVSDAPDYLWYITNYLDNIAEVVAYYSSICYPDAYSDVALKRQNAIKTPVQSSQKVVAAIINRFIFDTNKGDINLDGQITAVDARQTLRNSASKISFNDLQKLVADVDMDGEVTATDARIILRVSAKLYYF